MAVTRACIPTLCQVPVTPVDWVMVQPLSQHAHGSVVCALSVAMYGSL
jgi:hypothetical protein